jgi:hypothetical protein
LHKPVRLNKQAITFMKNHVYLGTKVLVERGMPYLIVNTISQPHVKLDGFAEVTGMVA